MRILLFTGKGGVGKTTTSAATALRLAERGVKTLLLSTDAAHSLGDALGCELTAEPTSVVPGLDAVQIDTQRRFEDAWRGIQRYLLELLSEGGTDPITAEELTVLPGIEEVLALLAVRDLALSDRWDVLVVDCAPTAETLRLLALPEALGWYLQRVFPVHRKLARGMRPLTALLGRGDAIPPDAAFDAVLRLADDLAAVRSVLADPQITSVRLVVTPEAVVTAEARRTFTALALYGYQVDEVVANRVFPAIEGSGAGADWLASWVAAQRLQLDMITESFAGLPVRRAGYRPAEPVGVAALRVVGEDLYGQISGGDDPAAIRPANQLMAVGSSWTPDGSKREFTLSMALPFAVRGEVDARRRGDDLVVTVAGHRRVLTLPSVLRRCVVVGGSVTEGRLVLRFEPDLRYWRSEDAVGQTPTARTEPR
ncbi:MAG TPA: ArsA family ATPase [Jatrophihabitans sp.]|jgi:arsenite-transporting ATPase